jgi:hypothetical protein
MDSSLLSPSDLEAEKKTAQFKLAIEVRAESEIRAALLDAVSDLSLPRSGDVGTLDIAFSIDRKALVKKVLSNLLEVL